MPSPEPSPTRVRTRREPPSFRRLEVRRARRLSPRLVEVSLAGPELEGFTVDEPAASVRLLLPSPGTHELVMPAWNGNQFLLPGGKRPTIRTFTPRRADAARLELDLQIVVHGEGAASAWAKRAEEGDRAAISGPGRGYIVDADATGFFVGGDETAMPAIAQLLEFLPPDRPVQACIEVADPEARIDLPDHPRAEVRWLDQTPSGLPGDALVEGVRDADLPEGTRVWVAGEAAAMQRIRRHLTDDRRLPRGAATVRGYWKHGWASEDSD